MYIASSIFAAHAYKAAVLMKQFFSRQHGMPNKLVTELWRFLHLLCDAQNMLGERCSMNVLLCHSREFMIWICSRLPHGEIICNGEWTRIRITITWRMRHCMPCKLWIQHTQPKFLLSRCSVQSAGLHNKTVNYIVCVL